MRTVSGLFDTYEHATEAVHALKSAGIRSADISLVANTDPADFAPDDRVGESTTTGAEVGAVLGGAGGLLAGLGILAVPGIGSVLAGGWLFATAIGAAAGAGLGAATGGLIGALTSAGISEEDANLFAESLRRGGALVTVRVDDGHADRATTILRAANGVDLAGRRADYEAEGWTRFDETPISERIDDQVRDYRDRYPLVPPVI